MAVDAPGSAGSASIAARRDSSFCNREPLPTERGTKEGFSTHHHHSLHDRALARLPDPSQLTCVPFSAAGAACLSEDRDAIVASSSSSTLFVMPNSTVID